MNLTPGKYTRSQIVLPVITGIVVHYVGNPGSSAEGNRAYFESIRDTGPYASYHEIIGLDGMRLDLIPHTEVAYHAGPSAQTFEETEELLGGKPNWRTLGVAYCHPDGTGKPSDKTEAALIKRVADLARRYDIDQDKIIRHYDCTGKGCPLWYVENMSAWNAFKQRVASRRNVITQTAQGGIIE